MEGCPNGIFFWDFCQIICDRTIPRLTEKVDIEKIAGNSILNFSIEYCNSNSITCLAFPHRMQPTTPVSRDPQGKMKLLYFNARNRLIPSHPFHILQAFLLTLPYRYKVTQRGQVLIEAVCFTIWREMFNYDSVRQYYYLTDT